MRRTMCGMTRPTQPIMPETETEEAVTSVAATMSQMRSLPASTPMARASSSPMARTLSLQRSRKSGTMPRSIGQMTKPRSSQAIPERLPMSQ